MRSRDPQQLKQLFDSKIGDLLSSSKVECSAVVGIAARAKMLELFELLKLDAELAFDLLIDVTCVDWLDQRPDRFEVVYELLSLKHQHRLRVKIPVPEDAPEVDSIVKLWSGANFLEREVWDMYGIEFKGHPDLRRILMYEEFEGHALRKDYPVQLKQPRVPMRSPEVHNTGADMLRADLAAPNQGLVGINPRKANGKQTVDGNKSANGNNSSAAAGSRVGA